MARKCSFATCKRFPDPGRKLCVRCLTRAKQLRDERVASGKCNNCSRQAQVGKKRCEVCSESANKRAKESKAHLRNADRYRKVVFDHYGRKCVCCGERETKFLTIDHINGRQEGDRSGRYDKIASLILKGRPRMDLRTLCMNCNAGRFRNGGTCPHEEARNGG